MKQSDLDRDLHCLLRGSFCIPMVAFSGKITSLPLIFALLLNGVSCQSGSTFNPIALRTAKTLWSFGLSESCRVKEKNCCQSRQKFFPLDPFCDGFYPLENRKLQRLSPFVKMVGEKGQTCKSIYHK